MRVSTPTFAAILAYSHTRVTTVDAYYAGALTLAGVPVDEGELSWDESAAIKASLSLTVPVRTPLSRLDPGNDPTHPLNCYGQILRVRTGMMLPAPPEVQAAELLDQGLYVITRWQRNDEDKTLTITGAALSWLLEDARLYHPETPPAGATFASEFTRLVGGILPVVIDPALADRALSAPTIVWERERAGALSELCDAWPARWYVSDTGQAVAAPPYPPVTDASIAAVTFSDGAKGLITARERENQRTRVYNAFVVNGATGMDGAAAPHAVAEITDAASPIRVGGPFGRRPRFFASDLITTQAQAVAVATAQRDHFSAFGRAEAIAAIPDPRVQLGDIARVFTADGDASTGRITKIVLPLTARQGAMAVTVSTLPSEDVTRR